MLCTCLKKGEWDYILARSRDTCWEHRDDLAETPSQLHRRERNCTCIHASLNDILEMLCIACSWYTIGSKLYQDFFPQSFILFIFFIRSEHASSKKHTEHSQPAHYGKRKEA